MVANSPDPASYEIPFSNDINVAKRAFQNGIRNMKLEFPSLIRPIITPVLIKNVDVLQKCRSDNICILKEALKNEDNYEIVFSRMGPILEGVGKHAFRLFDDMKNMAIDECKEVTGGCTFIDKLGEFKDFLPQSADEFA